MPKQPFQAHGLTHEQMIRLQHLQHNDQVENDATGSDNEDYQFPSHEKHLVHAEIEIPEFDQFTGAKKSTPKVQKYDPKVFKSMTENGGFAGYKVTIFHTPSQADLDNVSMKVIPGQSLGDRHSEDNANKLAGGFENGQHTVGAGATGNANTTNDNKPPVDTPPKEVKLNTLNKTDLTAKYTELYGEAPKEEWTKADLIEAIEEKQKFLEAEKNAANEQK